MKSRFIITSIKTWTETSRIFLSGYISYTFSNKRTIKTEECRICFENSFIFKQWLKEMGRQVVLPKMWRGEWR